jgi:hypothetical protein
VPKWLRSDGAREGDYGARSWKKGKWANDGEGGNQSATAPSPQAHGAAAGSQDGSTIARNGHQDGDNAAAASSAAAAATATEMLQVRREEVLKQATRDGVPADAAQIAAMGMEDLEAWAKNNLL